MTDAAIIQGQLVDARNVGVHKSFRLVIDVPAELAAAVIERLGWPTQANPIPVAVARLNTNAAGNDASAGEADPSHQAASASPTLSEKPRKSWHDMSPAQQAGMLCNEPKFQAYLRYAHWGRWSLLNEGTDTQRAALIVRSLCNVKSRSEITAESKIWRQLVADYRFWDREAEVVA